MGKQNTRKHYFESAHYTVYWRFSEVDRLNLNEWRDSSYVANRSLARAKAGDVLWIVNVRLGRLYLMGRIKVAFVTGDIQQAQELVNTEKAWYEADYYAIADRRDVEPLREIEITARIGDLHYVNQDAPLQINPLEPQQFRQLRELTQESADLLNGIWYSHTDKSESIQEYVDDYLELTEDDRAYSEGRLVMRTLTERQRNRSLVKDAKERFRKREGRLHCEVCGFDFLAFYGIDYIEAHHTEQMASLTGEKLTTTDALHMLCANCHRMVHTRTPPYSIQELRDLLVDRKG